MKEIKITKEITEYVADIIKKATANEKYNRAFCVAHSKISRENPKAKPCDVYEAAEKVAASVA